MPLWDDPETREAAPEPLVLGGGRVFVGTCGYSYTDWIGPFYPPGTRSGAMLEHYARRFPAVEIDSSYYRIPSEAMVASLLRRSPPAFRFTAKAPGTLTHVGEDAAMPLDDAALFRERIAPLATAGKLGALLLQFPNAFHPGPQASRRLAELRDAFPDFPLVAEFRHREWQSAATLAELALLDIGWCNVDEPGFATLLRPSSDVVGRIAYVRFHGRNARNWWKGDAAARYEYEYSADELEPWAARVSEMAEAAADTYVFFNNHRFGQAASGARLLTELLGGRA
jgi:uncharacterized protein YecE (DUF72 family)